MPDWSRIPTIVALAAGLLAAVWALWSPIVKILKGWWDVSEAKNKAVKAKAEAEAAKAEAEATRKRIQAEAERVIRESSEAEGSKNQTKRIDELAQVLRDYADACRRETGNRNLVFSSSELTMQLGADMNLFRDVMDWLERSGYAKKSWITDRWQIDADYLDPRPPMF